MPVGHREEENDFVLGLRSSFGSLGPALGSLYLRGCILGDFLEVLGGDLHCLSDWCGSLKGHAPVPWEDLAMLGPVTRCFSAMILALPSCPAHSSSGYGDDDSD